MNGYICFYDGTRLDVEADTPLDAQLKAQEHFQRIYRRRKVKAWDVSVTLAELAGQPVTQVAVD